MNWNEYTLNPRIFHWKPQRTKVGIRHIWKFLGCLLKRFITLIEKREMRTTNGTNISFEHQILSIISDKKCIIFKNKKRKICICIFECVRTHIRQSNRRQIQQLLVAWGFFKSLIKQISYFHFHKAINPFNFFSLFTFVRADGRVARHVSQLPN